MNLEKAILNGDAIYVVCSTENERVKMLQKMLLVRVMQIIKKRDRTNINAPICVVLDEFKHLLSLSALNALGVVRDFDAHIVLAHQSLGDLQECSGINPSAIFGAVIDNTSLKILFKISDPNYAETMAKLGGKRRVFVENSSKTTVNDVDGGSWKEEQVYLIPPELITKLPVPKDRVNQACVGVIYGLDDAQVFYTGPVVINAEAPSVIVAEPYGQSCNVNAAEDLI